MDYQTQITNSKLKLIPVLLFIFINGYSQKCPLMKIPEKRLSFNGVNYITELYDRIKVDDSSSCHIMLIRYFYQVNKKEAYCLSIERNKVISIKAVSEDSVIFSGFLNKKEKYNADFLLDSKPSNEYLISECNYVISSHKKSILLLYNHNAHAWIEYTSMDGHILEALLENKQYDYLLKSYKFLETVFQDVNITISKE